MGHVCLLSIAEIALTLVLDLTFLICTKIFNALK